VGVGRRLALLCALAAAVGGGLSSAAPSAARQADPGQPSVATLKLLQFNVLEGAVGRRADAVVAVIKASRADVVTLDEVNDKDTFQRMAASTGFHSRWVRANDNYSVGILSRFPLRGCASYLQPPIRHAAYSCRIAIGRTNWWIFGTHLYCCDEVVRSQEIALLVAQMKKHPRDPVVLAGDLNAQTLGENEQKLLLVIPMLKKAGYIDSYRELRTARQDPGYTITPPPYGQWERRIDYVFHSRAARAVAARVISTVAGYTWPSDHAAVYAQLINRPAKDAS
jgi:endonuclease/exonuclease/phosphatase family metal-dependent hydrolase